MRLAAGSLQLFRSPSTTATSHVRAMADPKMSG
jgi:hypothetical protein